jgi:hypothetical protein
MCTDISYTLLHGHVYLNFGPCTYVSNWMDFTWSCVSNLWPMYRCFKLTSHFMTQCFGTLTCVQMFQIVWSFQGLCFESLACIQYIKEIILYVVFCLEPLSCAEMFDIQATELSFVLQCLWLFDTVKLNWMAPAVSQATVPLTDQFCGIEPNTVLQLLTIHTALYYLRQWFPTWFMRTPGGIILSRWGHYVLSKCREPVTLWCNIVSQKSGIMNSWKCKNNMNNEIIVYWCLMSHFKMQICWTWSCTKISTMFFFTNKVSKSDL